MEILLKNISKTKTEFCSINEAVIDLKGSAKALVIVGNVDNFDELNEEYSDIIAKLDIPSITDETDDSKRIIEDSTVIFYLGNDIMKYLDDMNLLEKKIYQISNKRMQLEVGNEEVLNYINKIDSNELGFLKVLEVMI